MRSRFSQKLSGIEDSVRIERLFEGLMDIEGNPAEGLADPAFFGEADAVFAGDGAAPGKHPAE